jgi:hypothetical protein
MSTRLTLQINRAPVLTLWAAVVAERRGAPRDVALTLGQAVAGLNAFSKGVRLGILKPAERATKAPPAAPAGVEKVVSLVLLGRQIRAAETPEGLRAIAKGQLAKPESIEHYLQSKFGDALEPVRDEMRRLAAAFSPDELEEKGFHLYEQFRPEVPAGQSGWGAKGVLDTARIRVLART